MSQAHAHSRCEGSAPSLSEKRPHLAGAGRKSERELHSSVTTTPPPLPPTPLEQRQLHHAEVQDPDPPPIAGANIWVRFQKLLPLQKRDIIFILTDYISNLAQSGL